MRLAMLMFRSSPWARQMAINLSAVGNEIHVIDFTASAEDSETNYLDIKDKFQNSGIESFVKKISGLHLINPIFSNSLRYVAPALKLHTILRSIHADMLLALYGGGLGAMAFLSSFRPYSIYAVGSDVLFAKGFNRLVTRLALAHAHTVFANGQYLAQKARELSPSAKVIPLYIGIDPEHFVPGKPHDSPIQIVCSRGFLPVYNNEHLVQALATMPADAPDFRTTFVSKGPTLTKVQSLADTLLPQEKRKNLVFLNGVSQEEMIQNLQNSHIYVSVSRSEGTSISLLEALSCGLFPVVSDIPQNREWITPEADNGILVPLDKPGILAQALYRAMVDKDWRLRVSAYNRHLVEDRACCKKNMNILISLLTSQPYE